jgi:phytoene dehydrogenase-like protein
LRIPFFKSKQIIKPEIQAAICIVGGGVSGLVAAREAANYCKDSILLLEATETVGGRVQSDITEDGFTLDRGFAVFIQEYPVAKQVLDFEQLRLGSFVPGALVKIKNRNELAKVADPLRQPETTVDAILAPVGSLGDKLALLPLIYHVLSKTVEELFEERETDTLTALRDRWGIGDQLLDTFFKPFLEGIYLAPLEEQSSRMFSFIFKMFSEGAATLPEGGMGAVSKQVADQATKAGVTIQTGEAVTKLTTANGGFLVETDSCYIQAQNVIVATDGSVAHKLLSQLDGFESLENLPEQPQRSVGCLYYSFDGEVPVTEPILILNGVGEERGSADNPVNNICFPSVVNKSYAPSGKSLCSVTVLEAAMEFYKDQPDELDRAVRAQLVTWFPDFREEIEQTWKLQRIYTIPNAQPSQLNGPFPANVNGGREPNFYRNKQLPDGLLVCGDHMASATLNGALESGVRAGSMAGKTAKKQAASRKIAVAE